MGGSVSPSAGTAETLLLFSLRMILGRREGASVGGLELLSNTCVVFSNPFHWR